MPQNHRFHLVFCCLSSKWHFTAVSVRNLQSTVTRLSIFVFTYFFGAFHQTHILDLLLSNSCWTPFRRKRWPICKILSNASESSFSGSLLLTIIRATFLSFYYKIRAERHCCPKYGEFATHSQKPFIHRFLLVYLCVSCKLHFWSLYSKMFTYPIYDS